MKKQSKMDLHVTVAKYLDQNGFSKTLKKFIKEANVQKDNLDDSAICLEEIYAKYSEACNGAVSGDQKPEVVDGQMGTLAKCELAGSKKSKETTNDAVPSSDVKSKEKKKRKKNLDSAEKAVEEVKSSAEDVMSGEKSKKSKKRKGSTLEENDSKSKKTSESKHKKSEEVEKSEGVVEQLNGGGEQAGPDVSMKTPSKDIISQENGNCGKEEQKSAPQKSSKKQNGSASEPKTVNAFCRVKIDEVTFDDERLQDNSYWAKHGADSGYGAKAQEVLGQVRGRDFRHEKTKKKRGSYRGGQIDFETHSIKFNYSDEDE